MKMKVLFDAKPPFAWAHGGAQVLVEKLMQHLPELGVEVEPLRWWDEKQFGDILCLFYWPNNSILYAKKRGLKIVNYVFLDGFTSKSEMSLLARKLFIKTFRRFFNNYSTELGWNYNKIADAYIYPSNYDKYIGNYLFDAGIEKAQVILHGVDDHYLRQEWNNDRKGDYLISVGTIHERKNSLLLANIARKAKIPIMFLGKPYNLNDLYFKEFMKLVDNKYVLYMGFVEEADKIKYLKDARGFILLSRAESGNIAVLEAFALECPVFLPDLGWARGIYDGYAEFGHLNNLKKLTSQVLAFYNYPKEKDKRFPVLSWKEVTRKYLQVYTEVLENNIVSNLKKPS